VERFHSPNSYVAFKHNRGLRADGGWNDDLALQALTRFEPLFRDAIEAFAAEVFGNTLSRRFSRLPEQAQRPMDCNPRAFAAISGYGHGALLANPL